MNRSTDGPCLVNETCAGTADEFYFVLVLHQARNREKRVALGTAEGSRIGNNMRYLVCSFVHQL